MGLHIFGTTMNFNPHVHVLLTKGGLTNNGEMKRVGFIPYEMIRNYGEKDICYMSVQAKYE